MIRSVHLSHPSRKLFFLVHGYTGSPTDFNELPEYLHKHHDANVKILLLKGHGTKVSDLDDLAFQDFWQQVDEAFRKDFEKYDEVYLGGLSFGASLALLLAAKYPVKGVFHVCLPYKFRLPYCLPFLSLLGLVKKYWRKHIPANEQELRRKAFYYDHMHANGLSIVKKASRELGKVLPNIKCPILSLHSTSDPLGNYRAIKALERTSTTQHTKKIYGHKHHNLFFSEARSSLYREISAFLGVCHPVAEAERMKVAAIVPAYNEGKNIGRVLEVLTSTALLDEIIVIDDGSSDNTSAEAQRFGRVTLLRNSPNIGKAQSMQRGAEATNADILFFCDADLNGLTPECVEQIVRPVLDRQYDMFIGVRNNVMQKAVTLFALNSGERAVTRELWDAVPEHFKHRYRIEAGLNFMARRSGRGLGWKQLGYFQTLKEKKYGILKGTMLRWWMNMDVGYAYLLTILSRVLPGATNPRPTVKSSVRQVAVNEDELEAAPLPVSSGQSSRE